MTIFIVMQLFINKNDYLFSHFYYVPVILIITMVPCGAGLNPGNRVPVEINTNFFPVIILLRILLDD